MKIKKGDTVVVIAGKDKGTVGKIQQVFPKTDRVLVEGVNIISRHTKPRSAQDKGGIVKKNAPIHVSNVMFYENGKAVRIGYTFIDGKKVRVSKETGNSLDKEFVKAVKKEAAKSAKETTKKEVAPKATKAPAKKVAEAKIESKVVEKKATTRKTVAKSGK